MPKSSRRLPLVLTALLALAGCQSEDIHALNQNCNGFAYIMDGEIEICNIQTKNECSQKHDNTKDALKQSDFEGAFKYGRCPKGYKCATDSESHENFCKLDEMAITDCKKGDTRCQTGNIYICVEDNQWSETPTTYCGDWGCSEGTQQTAFNPLKCYECHNDDFKCDGSTLQKCIQNTWTTYKPCDKGCVNNECSVCQANEIRCDDNKVYECSGGQWNEIIPSPCEFGCTHGQHTYDSSGVCNECKDGDTRCANNAIQNCFSGKWKADEPCNFGCHKINNEIYQCKECKDGDYKYNNNEDFQCVKLICKDGSYYVDETDKTASCSSELTGSGECINGSPKCDNNVLKLCIDGAWKKFGACDSEHPCEFLNNVGCYDSIIGIFCKAGELKACDHNSSCNPKTDDCSECQNGTTRCAPNSESKKLQLCQDGVFDKAETICHTGTHCEEKDGKAACIPHDCENGEQRCIEGEFIQECKNYKWETTKACDQGLKCYTHKADDTEHTKAGCGCSKIDDTCADYEVCQNSVCQRKSCTEDSSLCGSKKCKNGECYSSGNNLSLCDDDRVKDMWERHQDVITSIIFPSDAERCKIYYKVKEVTNTEGTKICNQISTCGNPDSLETCMTSTVLALMADGYEGIEISHAVTMLNYLSEDHSSCIESCIDKPSVCTQYQQCDSEGKCVRKPCGLDESVCGADYGCFNDVCYPRCEPKDSKCSGKRAYICEDNKLLIPHTCNEGEYCVGEGASVRCSPEGD